MDFDEFDLENDVPLLERVAKKNKPKNNFYASDEEEMVITGFIQDNSLQLTPPPPIPPSTYKSSLSIDALESVRQLLDPKKRGALEMDNNKEKVAAKRRVDHNGKVSKEAKENEKKASKEAKEIEKKASKEAKGVERLVNKQTDKSEVNKYIVCIMDPLVVSSPPGPELLNTLTNPTSGKAEEIFQYRVENQKVPGLLTWQRRIIYLDIVTGGEPVISSTWISERRSLVFISAVEVADKIQQGTLEAWAHSVRAELGKNHHITLMVFNYNAYFKMDKNAQERARKAAVRGENIGQRREESLLSEYSMQEGLLTLSINRVVDYLTFDRANDKDWKECASSVFHQTRAVAEAPEKVKKSLSSSASFEFYAKADGRDCVSPKNLIEYWKQVIMQISVISLEKASAIVRQYPSPSLLINAYRLCSTNKERETLLSNLEIRRVDTIVGGTRRIGDEISRRVYLALTSLDPDSLLTA